MIKLHNNTVKTVKFGYHKSWQLVIKNYCGAFFVGLGTD